MLRFVDGSIVQLLRETVHRLTSQHHLFISFKVYCFLILFLAQAQHSIGRLKKEGKALNYLVFFGHSNQSLHRTLNQRFAYRQLLLDSFNQAPQFAPKVAQYPSYSTAYLEAKHTDAQEDKHRLGIAAIMCEMSYNNEGALNLIRTIVPEGKSKITNNVVSAYPYERPQIFNLLNGKEWTKVANFLNSNGVRFIRNILKKTMVYHAT